MLHQCKLLLSHCQLKVKFQRNPDGFYTMQKEDMAYQVKIKKAEMRQPQHSL